MTPSSAPNLDVSLIRALRGDLDAADYHVDGVEDLLGPVAAAALHREQVLPARRVVQPAATRDPRATLVSLFLLGGVVPRAGLDRALPATGTSGAERLGLVRSAGQEPDDDVRAAVDLRPYVATDASGDVRWWLASDLGELATGSRLSADHVLGAGGASLTLAQVTTRKPVARALDLGTGCGIQALHAARHAGVVVATDISRRALAYTAFNAALNLDDDSAPGDRGALGGGAPGGGSDAGRAPDGGPAVDGRPAVGEGVPGGMPGGTGHLDLRHGSMLEPVEGEQFDLVVSNPPFVITPHTGPAGAAVREALGDYEYRDGGRAGDDLVRDLVTGIGRVLAPGGVAQLLVNWEHRRGQEWEERVGAWLDEAYGRYGLDGWVIQREVLDPAEYAETWIRDGGTTPDREPEVWAAAYEAWLDDFASREVEAVGFGIVTLRRPGAVARDAGDGPDGADGVAADRPSEAGISADSGSTEADDVVRGGRERLRRLEEHGGSVRQPLGDHLGAVLAAHAWLAARSDDDVAVTRLVSAADVTEERYLTPGSADPNIVILRQGDGLGRGVQASSPLAALAGACDGELTVGQIIGALAALFEVPADDLRAELLPAVRGLVLDGFLVPAANADA
ncbi:SAM-dependent methyltransferase [Myceligenerans sp. TRM 65318]|uniref:SAM-dependent methyltransferase n=1 Tax=Myceligenerans pegani TaxID=2776917 RepID=A0ABR9N018_9MICO|nr:SAM-dependent methyltransferase [Myceligenerans sp. TRM 65318]MBE3019250.1 SAM-dependent methyltransferase [Myceligenerans sp. TRM 65318]